MSRKDLAKEEKKEQDLKAHNAMIGSALGEVLLTWHSMTVGIFGLWTVAEAAETAETVLP